MIGAAASYAYLSLLCRDVDNVKATDTVPIWEANKARELHSYSSLHITYLHVMYAYQASPAA